MNLAEQFLSHLYQEYPALHSEDKNKLQSLVSENLLSPFEVSLPKSVLEQAQRVIKTLFELTHRKGYQDYFQAQIQNLKIPVVKNHAIMMSYDFHLGSDGDLKLIEVNTNAAFLVLGMELYKMKSKRPWADSITEADLKNSIQNELNLYGISKAQPELAIVDDKPDEQRLFIEFLVAREMFNKFDFRTKILDSGSSEILKQDFIYNRDTDFYLQSSRSANLRNALESGHTCLSPHPLEYFLLADKQRLIDWHSQDFANHMALTESEVSVIQKHVPQSYNFSDKGPDEIWAQRKNFFFKPKRAFGSKQTYRGGSVSRKTFDALISDEFMAQEFVPAPEVSFLTPDGPQNFKYDLRCYAYQGQMQLVMARLYQGQVTNLRTALGGFATVDFKA